MNWNNFNHATGWFIITYHALLLVCLPLYFFLLGSPSTALVLATVGLIVATEMSITAGYHRFYAHRAFTLNRFVEPFLLLFGTLAAQGSVLRWSYEHRVHHQFVDKDNDPYCIKKGFWYAHIWWMFEKSQTINNQVIKDLRTNPLLMFQHKHYGILVLLSNAMLVLLVGVLTTDLFGAFVFAFLVRSFITHHVTWLINSLAHYWGSQTYSKELSAVDNYIIALFTFGEGYHNYHHTFASDYRNGVRWYHYDPTKWLVWSLSKLGLAQQLVRFNNDTVKRKLLFEDKKIMIARLKKLADDKREILETKIHELSNTINKRISALKQVRQDLKEAIAKKRKESEIKRIKFTLKVLKQTHKQDWEGWNRMVKDVMQLKPGM